MPMHHLANWVKYVVMLSVFTQSWSLPVGFWGVVGWYWEQSFIWKTQASLGSSPSGLIKHSTSPDNLLAAQVIA